MQNPRNPQQQAAVRCARNCDFGAAAAQRADDHAGDETRVESEHHVVAAAPHEARVDLRAKCTLSRRDGMGCRVWGMMNGVWDGTGWNELGWNGVTSRATRRAGKQSEIRYQNT